MALLRTEEENLCAEGAVSATARQDVELRRIS